MPTYDYECLDCGKHFEEFQSITAPAIEVCPYCGGHHVRRLISGGIGLIFKGSGFYITDYARKSNSYNGNGTYKNGAKQKGTSTKSQSEASSKHEKE